MEVKAQVDGTKLEINTCLTIDEEDQDLCCSWNKVQIEPTIMSIHLKFQDVRYTISTSGGNQCILQGVHGSVCPGEVLALMGPSGAGKTTLLNLLSGRAKINGGAITYNDHPYNKSLKQRIGFVVQEDIVFPHLTVKETLTYAALLRLPKTFSTQHKKERALNVISQLGLQRCEDTIIGGGLIRGISGGERKRVCIANEILLNPSLLFLDEPTSGLDSTTALRILHILHNIAKAGKTVVTTIHQPSTRLFSRFDKLILLGKGCSLYSGKASEAMLYFSSIGCSPFIAMNPAEFLIDLANGNIKHKSFPSHIQTKSLPGNQDSDPSPSDVHQYLLRAYESRAENMENRRLLIKDNSGMPNNSRDILGATWYEQFSVLLRRGFKERRHEYFSRLRIAQVIITAIISGLLWWHSDVPSPNRVADQAGLLFFISVFWAYFPVFTAIFTFPQERAMLAKERSVNMYKLSAYLVARSISDIPLDLFLPVIFLTIVYFMARLKMTFLAFSLTLLTVFLSIIAAQGLGLAIGAAFMDAKKATTFASIVTMANMLSGGFFIQEVRASMAWLRYISINYNTHRLLLNIQYNCSETSISTICDSSFIKKRKLGSGQAEVGYLLAMIIGYRISAYFLLRRIKL